MNVGSLLWNRTAKVCRHLAARARRVVKRSSDDAKHSATEARQTLKRGRDQARHVRTSSVRTARYWSRVRSQLLDPLASDLAIRRELQRVAAGSGPILVGPWLSEVGYEVLYWVPFVRWFAHRHHIDPSRLVVVSRGSTSAWYGDIGGAYVELLDLFTPDEFARRNAERQAAGDQKQLSTGSFDREILAHLESHAGLGGASVLHPSIMFRLLRRFWLGNASLEYVAGYLRFAPLARMPGAPMPALPGALPESFTAVKLYTGAAIPDSVENRQRLRAVVKDLACRGPVVTLDTGLRLDEHEDYLFRDLPNVVSPLATCSAAQNLAVQTEIIRRSSLFVGTCGGLAWLAPMLGIETVALYADDHFLTPHLYAARHAFGSMPAGRFMSMDLGAASRIGALATPAGQLLG